ncbi:MAG: Hsp20/alpha crystallin family protein [Syntrophobacterales bacterium]|nr:MAG: Hsp20/alpha crystallin family protein [Syntrophobacterales bacterium]
MTFMRWDPLKDLMEFQERMNRLFGEPFARTRREEVFTRSIWTPSVDIYETGDEITIDVELPEIDVDDLAVDIEGKTLTIKGERSLSREAKLEQYHLVERSYGPFSRLFTLPDYVDPGGIKGSYKNGILTLKLPKKGPKKIAIEE